MHLHLLKQNFSIDLSLTLQSWNHFIYTHTVLDSNSSTFTISQPGQYEYKCPGMGSSGNVTIVPAQYNIAICDGCGNQSNEYTVNPGDSVEWTFIRLADDLDMETLDCSTQIIRDRELVDTLGPCKF